MKSFDLGKSKTEQRFRSLFTRNVFTDYLEIDPNNNRELLGFNEGNTFDNNDNKSVAINDNNGNITNVNAVYLCGTTTKSADILFLFSFLCQGCFLSYISGGLFHLVIINPFSVWQKATLPKCPKYTPVLLRPTGRIQSIVFLPFLPYP